MNDVKLGWRVGMDLLASRRSQRSLRGKLAGRSPFRPHTFRIGIYFADDDVNMYQIRQWYKPLAELAKTWPVVILSRNATAANVLLDESPVPVAYVRKVVDLETFIAEQDLHLVLYVNQNTRNFQMMRYGRRWHVFINHGESDKMYMTTNQFKAYDYAFVAGDAAVERLGRVLWDYDFDKRAIRIGRPQADHYSGALPYTPDDRGVVLYAPTWEGDRAAAAYGSIATHGVALVRDLLASGAYRVIYRPHPRSGVVDGAYAAADREIVALLAAANASDPSAQHVHDTGAELGWQLQAADVAIVDISAMVYDRLAAGKPLLITRPVNPQAQIDSHGYLSDCEWLDAADAPRIVRRIDALSHDPQSAARLAHWVAHYFGDTTPGAATARFHSAVEHLLEEWERFAALHAADGDVDERDEDPDDSDSD
ncbi:CDP-glycerol:poly(glycerophosphate) glycerophosphotransferase [Compostimonas suwonensis]|uniref:CDP-glycerol:poly(Glycerophosphate) glycerophosphotransferase n=1 Tax=Compostimonas suwonensis TaxID=1048394 RepID=A0A2M9BWM8_9MICO|nr:CDP-glycerol:poly(glycerophosphate) glycerophosphotransferase [Compostimonas suwonensis]